MDLNNPVCRVSDVMIDLTLSYQQQQQHLFKHDKNYSGADVVVYLRS